MIGYEMYSAEGILWRRLHGAIIPFWLPHEAVLIDEEVAKRALRKSRSHLVRWDDHFDGIDCSAWWHVIRNGPYDLAALSKNTRNQIRRGAKSYSAKICDREFIAIHGYEAYSSSFNRYKTFERCFGLDEFQSAIRSCPDDVEFWGAFNRETGALDAFSDNVVRSGACFYSTMWFKPQALGGYAAYVLIDVMTDHYLNKMDFSYVSDGARSISHDTNVQNFLIDKFHFRKAYCKLRVAYSPLVYIIVTCLYPFRRFIKLLKRWPFAKLAVLLDQEGLRRNCL